MDNRTLSLIDRFIEKFGEAELLSYLSTKISSDELSELTVICNVGVHAIPSSVVRGEAYIFSRGNADLSSADSIKREMSILLTKLAKKLREKRWRKIYLVPSGHPLFYAHAKYMIYRVTRLEAIDVIYTGQGEYVDVGISHREIILESGGKELI